MNTTWIRSVLFDTRARVLSLAFTLSRDSLSRSLSQTSLAPLSLSLSLSVCVFVTA